MIRLGHPRQSWQVSKQEADLCRPQHTPCKVHFGAKPKSLTVDLHRAAVLVVDMQNDFCSPGGWLDYIGVDVQPLQKPVSPLNHILPELRATGVPVIWVNWGNRGDRLNLSPSVLHVYNPTGDGKGIGDQLPANGSKVLEKDSWGCAIIQGLDTHEADIFVDKYRMSGFWDTPLDSILRGLAVQTLFFAGVNVDQCVMATLQDANFLGYDCILLEDCSATSSPSFCTEATLYNIQQCYGFVTSSDEVHKGISQTKAREMGIQYGSWCCSC